MGGSVTAGPEHWRRVDAVGRIKQEGLIIRGVWRMNAFVSRIAIGLGFLGLLSARASADDYVVPPAYANANGAAGASFSLLSTDYTGQQAYSASLLSGIPVGSVI